MAGLSMLAIGCKRGGCGGQQPPSVRQPDTTRDVDIRTIDFHEDNGGPQKVVVLMPKWGNPGDRYPLLIALHGRGESNHGLEVGAWGWVRDYWLDRAMLRLRNPPIDRAALLGITDEAQLGRLNGALTTRPFQGLIVACPYTPDILASHSLDAAEPFAQFVEGALIPRLRAELPILDTKESIGIDGVSLGGRVALLVGLSRPKLFGAIGTLQAAIRINEVTSVADRIKSGVEAAAGQLPVRLVTSHDDPFRVALRSLAEATRGSKAPAQYLEVPGPHDYDFNRGPGSYEMLLWHDRALRKQPTP